MRFSFMTASVKTLTIAAGLTVMGAANATDNNMKPAEIDFSVSLETARSQLAGYCDSISEQKIEPAQIPGTKIQQTQLNCEGYEFQGAKRKAEFVYRDNELMLVWILTTAAEAPAFEAQMQKIAGAPSHRADAFTAFTQMNMALRKVPHEVLFYSDAAAPMFTAWFDGAIGQ